MAQPTATAAAPVTTAPKVESAAPPVKGADGKSAAPTLAEVRKLKLKLEGQDVELPESEVIALAQQGKVSGKRFEEAAAIRKQAQDIIAFAKSNPTEFFAKTGMNAREWAENYLMEELKREGMSPEQKKAADNEAELKRFKDEKKREEDKKLEDQKLAVQREWAEKYDKLFVDALGKSGLPKTAYTIKRMAELQLINIKKKLELGPDQLAKVVREDYIAEQKALYGASDGDQLLELLGPEITKKLSKAQIAKLKAKGVRTSAATGATPRDTGKKGLTWEEYKRRNRRLT